MPGNTDAVTYGYNAPQELTPVKDLTGTIIISEDAHGRRDTVTHRQRRDDTYGYAGIEFLDAF